MTNDGGYAVVGETSSFGAGDSDVYIAKFDTALNIQWTRIIGGPGDDVDNSIIQRSNGKYLIVGYSYEDLQLLV